MTCAECQDLLLDLAYGELDEVRSAEVRAHVAGCEACQKEAAQLAGVRQLMAPAMKTVEPSAAIDEVILRAAREEAKLLAVGTDQAASDDSPRSKKRPPGPRVVEVAGSISAPEAAAPVNVHAAVAPRAPEGPSKKRRWLVRLAISGSVAAAAALTLVVTDTNRTLTRPNASAAAAPERKDRAIRIRVPGEEPEPKQLPPEAEKAQLEARLEELKRREQASGDKTGQLQAAAGKGGAVASPAMTAPGAADSKLSDALAHGPGTGSAGGAVGGVVDGRRAGTGAAGQPLSDPAGSAVARNDAAAAKPAPAAAPPPPPPAPVAQPAPAMPEMAKEVAAAPTPAAAERDLAPPPPAYAAAPPAVHQQPAPKAEAESKASAAEAQPSAGASSGAAALDLPSAPMAAPASPAKKKAAKVASNDRANALGGPPEAQVQQGNAAADDQLNAAGQMRSAVAAAPRAVQQGLANATSAAQLETMARTARHGGRYGDAAVLYQRAAALHRRAAEGNAPAYAATNQAPAELPSGQRSVTNQVAGADKGPARDVGSSSSALAAALALAHAVECLAADARLDDARRVYEEILTSYPQATAAQATAQRALRSYLAPPASRSDVPADAAQAPPEPSRPLPASSH